MDVKQRMKGIGGSDVAPILGFSRFKTAVDIWQSKINEPTYTEPKPDDPATSLMYWGNVLEVPTLQAYEKTTDNKVIYGKDIEQLSHPKYPWLIANVDGFAFKGDEKIILEAKYTQYMSKEWGDEWTDKIPIEYMCQIQHYMYVCDLQEAHIAVWSSRFAPLMVGFYCVKRDDNIINVGILPKLDKFWHENVLKLKPPEPKTLQDVKAIYSKDNGSEIIATDEILETVARIKVFDTEIKESKKVREKYIAEVAAFLKDNCKLVSESGDVLARFATRKDGKRVMKII